MILLGDPAQLPAVSNRNIFGTDLWRTFNIFSLREVVRAKDPQLQCLLDKVRMCIHDEEVATILASRWQQEDLGKVDFNATVIIGSKRDECKHYNDLCLEMLDGVSMKYEAIDTDHNGMPIRATDKNLIQKVSDRLPDELHLEVGARVVVRRNINVQRGWLNGTIAQIILLATNCIVLCQVDKPGQCLALPRFKQIIKIAGASYHIVRRQFPVIPGYAVTVHCVQGMTVKKAIVLLNKNFFASSQAYVPHSRVRNIDDLTIWKYTPSAIHINEFYKLLLQWCDAQDEIRPSCLPSLGNVTYPLRPDKISNAPLPFDKMNEDLFPETVCVSHETPNTPTVAHQVSSVQTKEGNSTRKRRTPKAGSASSKKV